MELGCHSWMDCLPAELFLSSCFSDTVFVTLLRTAVETASSGVLAQVASHWRGPHLLNIAVPTVFDCCFADELMLNVLRCQLTY